MESGGIAPAFLTSALDGGEWAASCPEESALNIHRTGIRVSNSQSERCAVKRKLFRSRKPNTGSPAHSLLLYRLSYRGFYYARQSCRNVIQLMAVRSSVTSINFYHIIRRHIKVHSPVLRHRIDNPKSHIKSTAIPVKGRGRLQGCEMLSISHCLDNRLTDGVKVVSLTHRPHFTPQKHLSASGTLFC
jgi:hypothetical protein